MKDKREIDFNIPGNYIRGNLGSKVGNSNVNKATNNVSIY